jgi:hypothetical protein
MVLLFIGNQVYDICKYSQTHVVGLIVCSVYLKSHIQNILEIEFQFFTHYFYYQLKYLAEIYR